MKISISNHGYTAGLFSAFIMLLSACAGNSEEAIMDDARRFSAVTRIDPSFRPEIGASLMWYSDIIIEDEGSIIRATSEQVLFIENTIESQLLRKLYQFTDDSAQADYMIAAAVLLNEGTQSQQITNLIQIYPGLADAINDFEQGSLLMIIIPPTPEGGAVNAPILWRGVIQAYTLGEALPEDVQLARLEGLIIRLLDGVPRAGD